MRIRSGDRMKRFTCWSLVALLLGLAGCYCKAMPKAVSLGKIALSPRAEAFEATFSYPKGFFSGLTLAFHDGKGNQRRFCEHPDWPLVLSVEIRDKSTGQILVVSEITKDQMQYTSWHDASTSLLLNLSTDDNRTIGPGQEYLILIKTLTPDQSRSEGELFANWVQ